MRRYNPPPNNHNAENEMAGIYFDNNGGGAPLSVEAVGLPLREQRPGDRDFAAKISMFAVPDGDPEHGRVCRFNQLHEWSDPMSYPVLFPHGTEGFKKGLTKEGDKRKAITSLEFYRFRLRPRLNSAANYLFDCSRLFLQFGIDMSLKIEDERLNWYRFNQKAIRADLYQDVLSAADILDARGELAGRRIVLPSSFTGSPRYMQQCYQDAMANVRKCVAVTFLC